MLQSVKTKEDSVILGITSILQRFSARSLSGILSTTLWLLEKADEMWVCGDYRSSKGCQAEIEFCKSHKIPFTIKPNKNRVISNL